jgi:preprotein translocase subunit YajC
MCTSAVLWAEGSGGQMDLGILWLLPAILFLFYFLVLRPMRKQDQERQNLVRNLKKNDKVITTSGIYGTVVAIAEHADEITVKVDDNVRVRMLKSSILKNLTQEEALKAQKEGKDSRSSSPSQEENKDTRITSK